MMATTSLSHMTVENKRVRDTRTTITQNKFEYPTISRMRHSSIHRQSSVLNFHIYTRGEYQHFKFITRFHIKACNFHINQFHDQPLKQLYSNQHIVQNVAFGLKSEKNSPECSHLRKVLQYYFPKPKT